VTYVTIDVFQQEEEGSEDDVEEGKEVIQYEWNKDDSHIPAPYAL
jgi:hypothetical protein